LRKHAPLFALLIRSPTA